MYCQGIYVYFLCSLETWRAGDLVDLVAFSWMTWVPFSIAVLLSGGLMVPLCTCMTAAHKPPLLRILSYNAQGLNSPVQRRKALQ